jgi:predicted nucleic acid-binding protein
MCHVSTAVFADAVAVFERYDDQHLSVTDTTTVALTERHGIDSVLSSDDDLDGIVRRTDSTEL